MKYYSYIRCSTLQQSYDRQMKQLKEFCSREKIVIPEENIISEKRSGKNMDRPLFKALVEQLIEEEAKGEHCCLILVELSRMGRSYQGVKEAWNTLTGHGVDIVVTSFDLLDTRKKSSNNASLLVTDIIFSVLNYLTEQELREKQDRTNNGRAVAIAKGVKMGRKTMTRDDLPKEFLKVMDKSTGTETKTDLMDSVSRKLEAHGKKRLSRGTFYSWLEIYNRPIEKK